MSNTIKKLALSKTDKIIFGVCGGISEYYNWDSAVVRIITIAAFLFSGFFPIGLLYLLAAVIMPEKTN